MTCNALVFSTSLICATIASSAHAQDASSVQTVKELYASAAYEDALALMNRSQSETPEPEFEQYRAFCLIALGRSEEAQLAIQRLMMADPLYLPDAAETSPRMQQAFTQARQRLLPDVAKKMYADAKAALEQKDRGGAIARFEKLLRTIDTASPASESLTELRLLAAGFLDLSRALPEASPPVPLPSVVAADDSSVQGATQSNGQAVPPRPVAIRQDLPPWFPLDPLSQQREFSGSVRVHIGVDGRVESAEIVRSVHPSYDASLLRAARNWLYEPARVNGVGIPSDLIIQVQLRPRQ